MNKLLQRQLHKHFGEIKNIPDNIVSLLGIISESYDHFEKDRKLMERSIEISSKEMIELNTELNKEKEELKKAHSDLNALFENINEVFYSVDMKNRQFLQISAACQKVYGYSSSEFLADPDIWQKIIHEDDKHILRDQLITLLHGKQVLNQYRIKRKNGNIRWVENKIIPTLDADGQLLRIDGVANDITKRKQSELDLERSFSILQATLEASAEGILVVDTDLNIVQFNNNVSQLWNIPLYVLNENKKEKAIEIVLRQLVNADEFIALSKGLHYNKEKISLNVIKFIDNRQIECFSHPHLIHGKIVGRVWSFRDITAQKNAEAELELNNQQLEQKNKELEQFAYVASHDLQEPLRTISSFVEIFKSDYSGKLDSNADKYLTYIIKASDRMRVFINDLLDYSLIGNKKQLAPVDCNEILQNVMEDIKKAITESNASIEASNLPVINGYATEIKQLFQNLTINAIKFKKPDVSPLLKISATDNGDHWHFSFTDNGIGIEQSQYDRIFIIFQRLHNRNKYVGSGIGLSHCKKIVELHKGKVWVESKPGSGSTFHFTLHNNSQS